MSMGKFFKKYALDYYLQHCRQQSDHDNDVREVSRLLDELTELPILDHRKTDKIIGYNENHRKAASSNEILPLRGH